MAKESVTVSGTLRVRHTRTIGKGSAALPDESPMPRVAVRVQAKPRTVAAVWRNIGETITDFDGGFSVSSNEREADWRFRIDVRLKADDLVVRQHTNADWDTVLEQPQPRGEDLTGVRLIFGARAGSSTDAQARLDDADDRERAEVWVVARRALRALTDLGAPFARNLEIVTPSTSTWADPIARNVHLARGESFFNLLHESMHIWAYDHTAVLTGGQFGLIPSAVGGGSTHETEERESTAFHEGFAQFAAHQLQHIVFGADLPLPSNRAELASFGSGIPQLIRSDDGWQSILTTVCTPSLHRFDFGTAAGTPGKIVETASPPSGCASPSITFATLLAVFDKNTGLGVDKRLSRSEMKNLSAFLQRVATIARGGMTGRADELLRLLDPADTAEPRDLFCT
jgi:hypothetical protein